MDSCGQILRFNPTLRWPGSTEVVVFSRILGSNERDTVNQYLNGKYGFVGSVPGDPTNLVATALSASEAETDRQSCHPEEVVETF